MSRKSIGKKLRAHRLKLDVTQAVMARAVGVSLPSISAYERGKVAVSAEMVENILSFTPALIKQYKIKENGK